MLPSNSTSNFSTNTYYLSRSSNHPSILIRSTSWHFDINNILVLYACTSKTSLRFFWRHLAVFFVHKWFFIIDQLSTTTFPQNCCLLPSTPQHYHLTSAASHRSNTSYLPYIQLTPATFHQKQQYHQTPATSLASNKHQLLSIRNDIIKQQLLPFHPTNISSHQTPATSHQTTLYQRTATFC